MEMPRTKRASRGHNPSRNHPLLLEVQGQVCQARQKQHAAAHADASSLRQQQLVVFGAEAGHQHAEDFKATTNGEDVSQEAKVEQYPRKDTGEHGQKGLERSDPGDGRRRGGRNQCGGVVGLEYTKGRCESPGWSFSRRKLKQRSVFFTSYS